MAETDVKKSLRDALNQLGFSEALKIMSNIAAEASKEPVLAISGFHRDNAEAVYHLLKQISECPAIGHFSSRYFDAIDSGGLQCTLSSARFFLVTLGKKISDVPN